MKKTDIAMIIFIATAGVLISFFVVRAILGDDSSEPQKVQVIDKITSEIQEPDEKIFNANSINPSVRVEVDNADGSASADSTGQDSSDTSASGDGSNQNSNGGE